MNAVHHRTAGGGFDPVIAVEPQIELCLARRNHRRIEIDARPEGCEPPVKIRQQLRRHHAHANVVDHQLGTSLFQIRDQSVNPLGGPLLHL